MPNQLRMVWPSLNHRPGEINLQEGYKIRTFREGDEEYYIKILNMSDLGSWNLERLKREILSNPLSPGGIYFAVYDDVPVAVAAAFDKSSNKDTPIGEIGWVASDIKHRGKSLGFAVCASAVNHLLDRGYENIYLLTDHWRLPAVKTYLKLGFEPERTASDARFMWSMLSEKLNWEISEPQRARYVKSPKGEEIAWRTLEREKITEPCIITSWCMKRAFFQNLTHCNNIYESPVDTVIQAYIRVGANLCPQFIMPSPYIEHIACNPFNVPKNPPAPLSERASVKMEPEEVKNYIASLPNPDMLEKDFDIESVADNYAKGLLNLREIARGEILFIGGFGQSDFMGGYTRWGYNGYLAAIELYPEYLSRYYEYTGEQARLHNIAIAHAIEKYKLAPFVYGGQDICFNDGPVCSPETLNLLYFPYLKKAVQPLHDTGIEIIWHCDGNVLPIVDALIDDVGVSGFQGFQEETGCTLDKIANLQTKDGEKPIIWGSVSVTTTLPYGTAGDVKNDVERCFRVAGKNGGFALASTSSILPETPLENIITLFEHGLRFGREFL